MSNTLDVAEATRQADALLNGVIDEFTKPLKIPDFNVTDTTRATETLNRAEVSGGDLANILLESKKNIKSATEAEKEAIGKEGEAKAAGIIATQERQQKEAEGYQNFQRLYGVDISPNSAIAVAAKEQQKLRATMPAMRDRIAELQSSSPFDVVGYIMDSLKLPGEVAHYNATVDKVNSLQNAIDDGIQTARNAGDLNNKAIPTITASMATANANVALAEAAKKKAEADKQLSATNVDFASRQLTSDLALANATRETTQLDMQNERLKYESMVNAIRFADTHALRLEGAAKLLYDLADKRSLDVLLAQYDRNVGNPVGTTNRQLFSRLPAKDRDNIAAIGAGSAGTNPYEFLLNFNHPGPNLSPETGRLLNFVQERAGAIKMSPTAPKETHPQVYAAQLKADIEKEQRLAYKQGSLFFELSPAKMIAANAVPHGSLLEQVLIPLANTEGPVPTNTVISVIDKAYPNVNEAGQVVADYYKRNIDVRNKALNMSLMGMKAPTDYTVPVKSNRGFMTPFGETLKFDLTKPEEATKYLLLMKLQQKINTTRNITPSAEDQAFPMPVGLTESQVRSAVDQPVFSDSSPPARGAPKIGSGTKDKMPRANDVEVYTRDSGILNEPPKNPITKALQPKKAKM